MGNGKVPALPMSPGMRGKRVSSMRMPTVKPYWLKPPPTRPEVIASYYMTSSERRSSYGLLGLTRDSELGRLTEDIKSVSEFERKLSTLPMPAELLPRNRVHLRHRDDFLAIETDADRFLRQFRSNIPENRDDPILLDRIDHTDDFNVGVPDSWSSAHGRALRIEFGHHREGIIPPQSVADVRCFVGIGAARRDQGTPCTETHEGRHERGEAHEPSTPDRSSEIFTSPGTPARPGAERAPSARIRETCASRLPHPRAERRDARQRPDRMRT